MNFKNLKISPSYIIAIAMFTFNVSGFSQSPYKADLRFSPPEWQTSICLPDDPFKTLVDKNGALLYDYNQGGREFGTIIIIKETVGAAWKKQELYSPQIPIVKTYKSADGLNIVEEAFSSDKPSRHDEILVRISNTGGQTQILSPKLIVDTKMGMELTGQQLVINKKMIVTSSLKITGLTDSMMVNLAEIKIPAGKTIEFSLFNSPDGAVPPTSSQLNNAVKYWKNSGLPFDKITVPDSGIQALVNSSIRNIWQAREIKNGFPAFQVGPTCYRGLWLVDGAFILEAATILGSGDQARNGVAYELSHQKADGRIEVMIDKFGYWKENGIVLWTCIRHAMLTQDKLWLEAQWPKLERIAIFIKELRGDKEADPALEAGLIARSKHSSLDEGLMPHGIIDGGIHDGVDYSNTYWNLLGLRSFVEAANWLGKTDEATVWQKEYDDFLNVFNKAVRRDLTRDSHGNTYLPDLMGDSGKQELPQRAQWAFCQAVYPGQVFSKDDPVVAGNLSMLEATEREGMVYGTGWNATGIWNYFASFYGHAWLWQGNGRKAAEALYAFANHAAPTLVWREEQSLQGEKFNKVGDMPHNWASAEFIRLTVHMLELDRGKELHLLEGLPQSWAAPGMVTRLNGVFTPFGQLFMELTIAADGRSGHLKVKRLTGSSPAKIVLHMNGLTEENSTRELSPDKDIDITVPLRPRTQ